MLLRERKRKGNDHIGLITFISVAFLIGVFVANWESKQTYNKFHRSSILATVPELKDFADYGQQQTRFLSQVSYAADITTRNWIKKLVLKGNITVGANCPVCSLGEQEPGANSNKRDVILTSVIGSKLGPYFIKSIRSVNCRARIVILASSSDMKALEEDKDSLFGPCCVHLIDVGEINNEYQQNLGVVNHMLYSYFLCKMKSSFDRVLIVNSTSAIFQKDPFTTRWNSETFGFAPLSSSFENTDEFLRKELNILDPLFAARRSVYEAQPPISDRIIYGSVSGVMSFYSIMFTHEHIKSKAVLTNGLSFASYINWHWANGLLKSVGFYPCISTAFRYVNDKSHLVIPENNDGNTLFTIDAGTSSILDVSNYVFDTIQSTLSNACDRNHTLHRVARTPIVRPKRKWTPRPRKAYVPRRSRRH